MQISFGQIEREFKESFGYVRQDIAAILEKDLNLNYTSALLVCCACEMLTWHRGLRDDQAHEVFTSMLPDAAPYKAVGKTLWEALRNGLAHNFRLQTIKIEDEEWRFTISSRSAPLISAMMGRPNWIRLNIRVLSSLVISQIDAYEEELQRSADIRLNFQRKSQNHLKTLDPTANKIAVALRSGFQ